MKLVFLSEHYEPRVGGVTSYIKSLCGAIHQLGHEIYLITPGVHSDGQVNKSKVSFGQLISIGTDIDLTGVISSSKRKTFCTRAANWIKKFHEKESIDAVHILYGLYLMKYLNIDFLKGSIYSGCTIHNVPPEECATSWYGDGFLRYWKDQFRLKLVGWVNKNRIRSQSWTSYVVPSQYVAMELSRIVNADQINVIGHGLKEVRSTIHSPTEGQPLRLLTVSGFTPHKCQHIIPSVLKDLISGGLNVKWDVIGPNKNNHYVRALMKERDENALKDVLNFHFSVSSEQLENSYVEADIYVHTSKEEGFCLAVLEAATYGLPVLGRRTGAIPEIIQSARGELFSNTDELKVKILEIVKHRDKYKYDKEDIEKLKSNFSWSRAAQQYIDVFRAYSNS